MPASRLRPRLVLLLVALLAVGLVVFLRTRVAWDEACSLLRERLPEALGMDVGVGQCEVDPLSQSVTLKGVSVFAPEDDEPLFAADSVQVSVSGVEMWTGRLSLGALQVQRPRIRIDLSRPGPGRPGGRCPLRALKRIRVEQLDIKGAELDLALPDGRSVALAGLNLVWTERRGLDQFRLETSQGLVDLGHGTKEFALAELRAEGAFSPAGPDLSIAQGELILDDVNLSFSGKLSDLCAPTVTADAQAFVPLQAVAKATSAALPLDGHLLAHLSVSGPIKKPLVFADVLGRDLKIGGLHAGDFAAHVSYAFPELRVHELSFSASPGGVKAQGVVRLAPGLPMKATVELKQASFGRILARVGLPGSWVDYQATGRVTAQGRLLPWPELEGGLELAVERFRLTTHPFDAQTAGDVPLLAFGGPRVRLAYRILRDRAELLDATVESDRSRVAGNATLHFSEQRGLDISVHADALDLGDVGALAGIAMRGHGSTRVELSGPYTDPRIEAGVQLRELELGAFALGVTQGRIQYAHGHLRFPGVTGQKGRTQYYGSGELDFTGKGLREAVQVEVTSGRVEDLVDSVARLSPRFFSFFQGGALVGDASGALQLDSPVDALDGRLELDVKGLAYQGRRLGDGKVALRVDQGGAMVLPKATFIGPLGVSYLEGSLGFDGALDYRFGADPLSLDELLGETRARRFGLGGLLSLAGTIQGTTDVPVVSGYLASAQVTLNNRGLGPMHLEGRVQGRDAQVFGTLFGLTHGSARFTLKDRVPYEATVELQLPDLWPILPARAASQGLSGSLEGTLTAAGDLLDSSTVNARGAFRRFILSRGDFVGQSARPFSLSYAQGRLAIDGFEFDAPNTQLAVAGSAGQDDVDMSMRGTLDMRLLESFVPGLERTGGTVEVSATASGKLDNPTLVGGAEVRDVQLSVREPGLELRALSGRAEFSASRVLLEDVQGVLNDGRLSLRGDIALSRFQVARVEIGAQLDDVSWRLTEDLPLFTSGALWLTGSPSRFLLSGDLDLMRLKYDKPLVLETLVTDLLKRRPRSPEGLRAERPKEWLTLDVGVHLKDALVDNNVARAKILGNLKVTGTNVEPGLLGTLEAGDGSQAFYRGNQFTVTQGQVEFNNRKGLDGLFDVHAETQVREYLVKLHAFGQLAKPQVVLNAEPYLSEADVISLLTLGVTSHDKANTTRAGTGLAAEVFLNYSGLDRQVQRFLPKNPVLKDLSVHMATTYNDAIGQAEPTAQLESKFLIEQLRLRMSQPVSGHGTRAQAEYHFDDRISAQAQWDNEQSNYTFGNLGLDLKLRWDTD